MSFRDFGNMNVTCILVGLDLRGGIADSIALKKGTLDYFPILDYKGVPFKCLICHVHSHMEEE